MKIAIFGAGAVGGRVAAWLGAGAAAPYLATATAFVIEKACKAGLCP